MSQREAGELIERIATAYDRHSRDTRPMATTDGCCAYPFENCRHCGGQEFSNTVRAMLDSAPLAWPLAIAQATLAGIAPMTCFLVMTSELTEDDEECGKCFSCLARKAQRRIAELLLS
jgi:hypothetical protein